MGLAPESLRFMSSPVHYVDTSSARIAYRKIGAGEPLLLLHGWPLSSLTFRKLMPLLEHRFTCYLPDLPGAGDSTWTDQTDFSFEGRARILADFVNQLKLRNYFLLAQDTGATVGRFLALLDTERIQKIAMINTEIPHHRPPWIPLYRRLLVLPGSELLFRQFLRSRQFVHSALGFGSCFWDRALLDGEFTELVINPIVSSARAMRGQVLVLRGIDWAVLDGMADVHSKIQIPVLLIWGEDDATFPVERAREMAAQFPKSMGVKAIPHAKLLVQEERPEAVSQAICDFFLGHNGPLAQSG
jgi:pimeloyl-ACP methyl ester carboxylesterase